ncbi:hypothetical protein [Nannocystis pusilla]|uniref:Uncharacterized protein n=1 Tax=Nannocystis pusilla TaxID=889268 RepID=A0ABS7TQX0_9BACT|nr:hypothetical protein [Nannocystis pusilla]MBZ5710619.1 hypothetical protein [Nannocystis pusilla]
MACARTTIRRTPPAGPWALHTALVTLHGTFLALALVNLSWALGGLVSSPAGTAGWGCCPPR